MFKRTMALLLACSLAFAPVNSFAANETTSMPLASQSIQNADTLKALNLIKGDATGLRLNEQLSRAEALVLIVKLLGDQDKLVNEKMPAYKDVKSTDWFAPYIAYAKQNGIASGISNDQFAPNSPVNEKQFLKMILSAMHYEIGKDFTWEGVEKFAASKGYPTSTASDNAKKDSITIFNRSNAFDFTFTALKQAPKDEKATVLEKLVTSGKIDQKLLEQPAVSKTIEKKLIETIQATVAPKATSTTAPTVVAATQPIQITSVVSPAPSGGFSGGGSGGGSYSGGSGGGSPTPTPTPVIPTLPAKEVELKGIVIGYYSIDIYFSEELDAKTAGVTGIVKVNNELSVISTKYIKGEKRLHIKRGPTKPGMTYKVTIDPAGLKTDKGNPVSIKNPILYFTGMLDSIIYTDNTPTEFNLYINGSFKLEKLSSINQITITRTDSNEVIPLTGYDFNTEKHQIKLFADPIPKNTPCKISIKDINLYSEDETFSNYVIDYKTSKMTPPTVSKAEFTKGEFLNTNGLDIKFNESITKSELKNLKNYKLYKSSVSPENLLKIDSIVGSSDNSILLSLKGLTIDLKSDYILVIDNMTSYYENVKSEGPIVYTIKGTGVVVEPTYPAKEIEIERIFEGVDHIDILFSELLDKKAAETTGVVTINYSYSENRTIKYAVKKLEYKPDERILRAYFQGIPGKFTLAPKITIDPTLLKTADKRPVHMNVKSMYCTNWTYTYLSGITNNKTQLTLDFDDRLKINDLNNIGQISVTNETTKNAIPLKHYTINKDQSTIVLNCDSIPENTAITINFNNVNFESDYYKYNNYEVKYHTKTMAAPIIDKIDVSPFSMIVHFNELMKRSDIDTIENYKLYRNAISKENQVPIKSASYRGDNVAIIQINSLIENDTYILVLDNMTTEDNVESNGSIIHSFICPINLSSVSPYRSEIMLENEVYLIFSNTVDQSTAMNVNNYFAIPTTKKGMPYDDIKIQPTKITYNAINDAYILSFKDDSFMVGFDVMLSINTANIKDTLGRPLAREPFSSDLYLSKNILNKKMNIDNPYMTSASSITFYSNHAMDLSSVSTLSNYAILDEKGTSIKIYKATSLREYNSIILDVDPIFKNNQKYKIVINNLKALNKQTQSNPTTLEFTGKSLDQTPPEITRTEHVTSESAIYLYVSEPLLNNSDISNVANYKVDGFTKEACMSNDYSNPVILNDLIKSVAYIPEQNAIKWIIDPSKLTNIQMLKCNTTNIKDLYNNDMFIPFFCTVKASE